MVSTLKMAAAGLVIMTFVEMNIDVEPEIRRTDTLLWLIHHMDEQELC